jgi:copper resistance protein D
VNKVQTIVPWFGAEIDAPMVVTRAVQFAASAVTAGMLIFRAVVAAPVVPPSKLADVIDARIRWSAWSALLVTIASGAVWFVLQAASMSGLPLGEAVARDTLSAVLNETQFGLVAQLRAICAVVLAVGLFGFRSTSMRWLSLAAALGLVGAIAWTGHAGATTGEAGVWHLAADILHLWAAAAWIGGLVGLMLVLLALRQDRSPLPMRTDVVRRFSTLGLVSVATLIVSGAINSWILVGSVEGLFHTVYGRLLVIKLVIFAAMLVFAAVNRIWLTPRLASSTAGRAAFALTCSTGIEFALGLLIFAVVGVLGTQHPAIHFFL